MKSRNAGMVASPQPEFEQESLPMFNPETPPELDVVGWFNAPEAITLAKLQGRVVVLLAFQMQCQASLQHALPQLRRLRARFSPEQVAIIALHAAFENHAAQTPEAVGAFLAEEGHAFPVAVDRPDGENPPHTMTSYEMQGTPTMLLFDRAGRLRRHYFGQPDDILLAAEITGMAIEDKGASRNEAALIERKLGAILLSSPHAEAQHGDSHGHDHHHDHGAGDAHDACGCGHDHHHDHHHHGHDHGASRHGEAPAQISANGAVTVPRHPNGQPLPVGVNPDEPVTEPPRKGRARARKR